MKYITLFHPNKFNKKNHQFLIYSYILILICYLFLMNLIKLLSMFLILLNCFSYLYFSLGFLITYEEISNLYTGSYFLSYTFEILNQIKVRCSVKLLKSSVLKGIHQRTITLIFLVKPTILHKRFSISDFRATIIYGSLRLEDILSIALVLMRTKIFSPRSHSFV